MRRRDPPRGRDKPTQRLKVEPTDQPTRAPQSGVRVILASRAHLPAQVAMWRRVEAVLRQPVSHPLRIRIASRDDVVDVVQTTGSSLGLEPVQDELPPAVPARPGSPENRDLA